MSENKQVVAWITKDGRHIPIYAINVPSKAEQKKEREIAQAKEQANRLNGKGKLSSQSTLKEIMEYYKSHYNISIDSEYFYQNMSGKFLVKSADNLDKLYAEFPVLKDEEYKIIPKDFKHTRDIPKAFSNTTALSKSDYKNEIWLNTNRFHKDIFDALEHDYAEAVEQHKFPANTTVYNALVHELGHKVEIAIAKGVGISESALKYNDIAFNVIKGTYKEFPKGVFKSLQKARDSISLYSGTNYDTDGGKLIPAYEETFAEAISDFITNGNNANIFSKKIVTNIKEILKDLQEEN